MMMNLMMRLWKDEEGQGIIEYALIIGLVAIALIVGARVIIGPSDDIFVNIRDFLTDAKTETPVALPD